MEGYWARCARVDFGQAPDHGDDMSGRKRPDIDLVAVADAGATHDGVEEVVDSTRRPAARAYGRLALASRRPLFRRIAQVVIVLGVGVAVAVAVFRGPRPGSPPASPLVSPACASGQCSAIPMTDAELHDVRVALSGYSTYSTSGLRLRDAHNVPVLIEVVSTDGAGVLTINAARVSHAPAGWASENIAPVTPQGPNRMVVRAVVRSPTDQAQWAVEVRAIIPSGSTTLLQAARSLAVDGSLVA
jgi:hypothetical protein